MEESDEMKGKIKFYGDEVEVLFPKTFDEFKVRLGEMLGLTEDFLPNIKLTYPGDSNNKVEINNSEDYDNFNKYLNEKKESITLDVEVKDESNINIKKVSSSILEYKEKRSSENFNINNEVKEEKVIKEKNSLELSDEINPNDIKDKSKEEKKENEDNNINNISNEINNINNEDKNDNNKLNKDSDKNEINNINNNISINIEKNVEDKKEENNLNKNDKSEIKKLEEEKKKQIQKMREDKKKELKKKKEEMKKLKKQKKKDKKKEKSIIQNKEETKGGEAEKVNNNDNKDIKNGNSNP